MDSKETKIINADGTLTPEGAAMKDKLAKLGGQNQGANMDYKASPEGLAPRNTYDKANPTPVPGGDLPIVPRYPTPEQHGRKLPKTPAGDAWPDRLPHVNEEPVKGTGATTPGFCELRSPPRRGQIWRHHANGHDYLIEDITIDEETQEERVIYTRLDGSDPRKWDRKMSVFMSATRSDEDAKLYCRFDFVHEASTTLTTREPFKGKFTIDGIPDPSLVEAVINWLIEDSHGASRKAGWYTDRNTGEPIERNVGELIALMHSELSEMLEGVRKGAKDTHLVLHPMEHVEAADLLIRLLDYCGYRKVPLTAMYFGKRAYNDTRADHKLENRRKPGGKGF